MFLLVKSKKCVAVPEKNPTPLTSLSLPQKSDLRQAELAKSHEVMSSMEMGISWYHGEN
jgi:hypothetical protein